MKYMTIGLKRVVSLALLPIDDFTDQIITGSQLRVYAMEGNISSIRKSDGYHIFCDLSGGEVEICLEGPLYQKRILRLPIVQGKPKVCQVRMLPAACYPLPRGTTIVSGILPMGTAIRLFLPGKKRGCKLLQDYDPGIQGEELSLFLPCERSFLGKLMCVCGKERDLEFFRVIDQKGNICIAEHALSKGYQRTGTNVYPVNEASVGEDGSFYLPVGGLAGEETCICILTEANGEEKRCEIMLTAGKENRITEDIWKEGS